MAHEFHTILRSAKLPWSENETSRRYLRILQAWVTTAAPLFAEWPVRPNCGYFYGGCAWYGEETCAPAFVFALVASSPEYDPALTGCTRHELRQMAYKGLRYLCFTHDTGPADCIRPAVGMGRHDCCANKWGERGRGFFTESQCGVTLGQMAVTALLLSDLLDDETWAMLEAIFTDYAERFAALEPRSGVFLDTQMEENAWTSLGLASAALMLGHHPRAECWHASARKWMFLTAAAPQDAKNKAEWLDGSRISDKVFKTFTALPDYMAENHGMVHPTYTAASMTFLLNLMVLFGVFNLPLPVEALFNRREIYQRLKNLTDRSGMLHPVQGMDWPYLRTCEALLPHTAAALLFHDPDASYLELLTLERAERIMASNEGRMYHRDIGEKVSNIQDPLIMWEYQAFNFAYAYAAHRLSGSAPEPTTAAAFEAAQSGVHVFPHSGFVFHRHKSGQTSLAWRNTIMALPLNKDGIYTVAPATGSILAQFEVQNNPESQRLVSVHIDEHQDCFVLNLMLDRCQASVRQEVLYASLPDGTSLLIEHLSACRDVTVSYVKNGFMRIINERYNMTDGNCRGSRTIYSAQGQQVYNGYVSTDSSSDIIWRADGINWLNIDDRMGILFSAKGPTTYLNRHYFHPWWAVADDLLLGQQLEPRGYPAGGQVSSLAAVYIPDQSHSETAQQAWQVVTTLGENAAGILARGYLALANWGKSELNEALILPHNSADVVAVPIGGTTITDEQVAYQTKLKGYGASLRRVAAYLQISGTLDLEASEQGKLWLHNAGKVRAVVTGLCETAPLVIPPGDTVVVQVS